MGPRHDRDVNAASNVLAVGQTISACGATVRPKASNARGGCDEAGRNSSDAVKTKN